MKTIRRSIDSLLETAKRRPEGYFERVVSMGTIDGQFLILPSDAYLALVEEYSPNRTQVARKEIASIHEPKPREDWPSWAKAMALVASSQDRGLGDTIARIIGPLGGDAFKKWAESIGLNCGCDDRQLYLNTRFPLR